MFGKFTLKAVLSKLSKFTCIPRPNKAEANVLPFGNLVNEWQTECEKAVRIFANLLHLVGRRFAGSAIIELLRSAPRTPEEMSKESDSLLLRCAKEANDGARACDAKMLDEFIHYIDYLAKMPPSRRAMLEASVTGVILGHGMGA